MSPLQRHKALVHVDRHNTLPSWATADDLAALAGLIKPIGLGTLTIPTDPKADIDEAVRTRDSIQRYQLTQHGARAVVQSGPIALRPEPGRVA